ncbi:MAG: bifunctional UDP-N-acetylmuramoyl-tripeptide:D-alanyl-D-alanine ligase/alanine racemase, partial [Bacteroidales bacterium]|nr:bifunctional UDP-N-acetylmuramoyl-tripeptide:D-alanyl-D-alanine ligase/alanine racemase [Bacteroidales bacterium]
MNLRSGEIAEIVAGKLVGPADISIAVLVVDSRKATMLSSSSLFIALRGKRNDGHQFIDSVYRGGVRSFMVEEGTVQGAEHKYPDAAFIYTDNTLDSLHKIAAWNRNNYNGIVIGVTGSNGKTIVKEWIAETIGKEKSVVRSPRSFNSQTGVPLSVWQLDNRYEIAVLEAGMSMPGEIAKLEKIIKPHIGIFTNIGEAHQENFRDIESKVAEKLNLFTEAGTIIYSVDHPEVHNSIKNDKRFEHKNLVTWSIHNYDADVRISIIRSSLEQTELNIKWSGDSFTVKLPF